MCETHNKEDYYTTCVNCGEEIAIDFATATDDGSLCEKCLEEFYGQCSNCGGFFLTEDLTATYDGVVCDACLENCFYCERCKTFYDSDYVTTFRIADEEYGYTYVCENCLEDDDEVLD